MDASDQLATGYKYCGEETRRIKKEFLRFYADNYGEEYERLWTFCRMTDGRLVKIIIFGRIDSKEEEPMESGWMRLQIGVAWNYTGELARTRSPALVGRRLYHVFDTKGSSPWTNGWTDGQTCLQRLFKFRLCAF